jgi:hypothetical protein
MTSTEAFQNIPWDPLDIGYCWRGDLFHVFKCLPGITLQVLQQHLQKGYGQFPHCGGFNFRVTQHETTLCGFVVTVHNTHIIAQGYGYNAIKTEFLEDRPDFLLMGGPSITPLLDPAWATIYQAQSQTPTRCIYRHLPRGWPLWAFCADLSSSEGLGDSPQPFTVTRNPCDPTGIIVTVCLGNYVTVNEDTIDAALAATGQAFRQGQALRSWVDGCLSRTTALWMLFHSEYLIHLYQLLRTLQHSVRVLPRTTALWMLFHLVVSLVHLYQLLRTLQHRVGTFPPTMALPATPPTQPRLWKRTTATPQVYLPGILGLVVLLTTIIQCNYPRILPHHHQAHIRRSVSYGLRWHLAVQAQAMATAWDLITQTYLEL